MKIKIIIMICLCALICVFGFEAIYIRVAHRMEYKPIEYVVNVEYKDVDYGYSKKQIRNKLEELTGVNLYFYKEKH